MFYTINRIKVVAYNTFIEAVRDRILYSLLIFAVFMILGTIIISSISAEQYNKITKDLGLTTISIIGILISIFLGMNVVYKEIDKKTVYNLFSKPVRRFEFILGKYLGISLTLFVITIGMSVILFLLVFYVENKYRGMIEFHYGGQYYAEFVSAIYFTYLEFLIVIGLSLVFSSFTTPIMTVMFVLLSVGYITEAVYRIVPHLDQFNLRNEAVYGGEISLSLFLNLTAYAFLYCVSMIILSIAIFEKKEFN
jgi:ABC-type transport system involved in multi-copper enzyme maturation permease subunit